MALKEWQWKPVIRKLQRACRDEKGIYMFTSPLYASKRAIKVYGKEELVRCWKWLQDDAKEYGGLAPAQVIENDGSLPNLWFKEEPVSSLQRRTLVMLDLAFEDFSVQDRGLLEFLPINE